MGNVGRVFAARRLGFLARGKWLVRFYFYGVVEQVIDLE